MSIGVTPLTVSEARAILVTNESLDRLRRTNPKRSLELDDQERRAWQHLVESARLRVDQGDRARRSS